MIKLKSLFRRGQGPSGSSKHSTNVNNSLRSTSTSSLNSIGLSTTSTSTTATTKSSKSALKKANLTGSNDHFDTGNFRESHESLDIKQIATSLYAPGGGSGAAPNTIQSTASVASSSTSLSKHQRRGGGGGATRKTTERDQFQYINSPQLQHQQQSASMSLSMPIEQHLASSDDGSASCYSSSMRDLLSTDHFADDNTFTGTDEFQVFFALRLSRARKSEAKSKIRMQLHFYVCAARTRSEADRIRPCVCGADDCIRLRIRIVSSLFFHLHIFTNMFAVFFSIHSSPGNWLCGLANVCLRDRPRASSQSSSTSS